MRLNKKSYDRTRFTALGLRHVDLYFVDGGANRATKPAEAFFVAALRVVDAKRGGLDSLPKVRRRLGCFAEALHAADVKAAVRDGAARLEAASGAAVDSEALAEALKRLLDVGNALNEGTARGNAIGFTLASLERLATTKSVKDGATVSVLDFAARKPLVAAGGVLAGHDFCAANRANEVVVAPTPAGLTPFGQY